MNHWPFVIASYAVVLLGTAVVVASSFFSMRRAETKADALKKTRK